jgi:hypothetical protein
LPYRYEMTTRPALRLAVALLVVVSTLGAREPAAAAAVEPYLDGVPSIDVPEVLVLAARPDIGEWLAEDERQRFIARDQAWIDAERAEWLRIEAEREEWLAAERARAVRAVPRPPRISSDDILRIITDAALRHGIDPVRFARIAGCESGGDPNARNPSGASGLFQQLPRYWAGRAAAAGLPGADIFDPWANAEVSAWLAATGGFGHWNESRGCWS